MYQNMNKSIRAYTFILNINSKKADKITMIVSPSLLYFLEQVLIVIGCMYNKNTLD